MYIYSLDRKTIIKASKLSVQKNYGGRNAPKFAITAESSGGLQAVIAGLYPDEKSAVDALEKAFQALADGAKYYKFD